MKTAAILAFLAGSANAFAPSTKGTSSTSLNVAPGLDKMVGVSIETGGKVVSVIDIT